MVNSFFECLCLKVATSRIHKMNKTNVHFLKIEQKWKHLLRFCLLLDLHEWVIELEQAPMRQMFLQLLLPPLGHKEAHEYSIHSFKTGGLVSIFQSVDRQTHKHQLLWYRCRMDKTRIKYTYVTKVSKNVWIVSRAACFYLISKCLFQCFIRKITRTDNCVTSCCN